MQDWPNKQRSCTSTTITAEQLHKKTKNSPNTDSQADTGREALEISPDFPSVLMMTPAGYDLVQVNWRQSPAGRMLAQTADTEPWPGAHHIVGSLLTFL